MAWTPPPKPNYERDVERLIQYYRLAMKEIVLYLMSVDPASLDARMQKRLLKQIEEILSELNKNAKEWIEENIPKAYREGQASALVSLGEAASIASAIDMVTASRLNRHYVEALINDTYDDLLQATQNTRRRVKQVIREIVAHQLRLKAAQNLGRKTMTRDVIKEMRERLGEAGQFAIRDRANRVWKIEDYADVVVRTKIMQAHIEGSRNEAMQRGALYGVISSHGATDACKFHEGRIVKLVPEAPGPYPTVEQLRASGQIFHPRCRHNVMPIRDPNLLPASVREKAERQAEVGDRALATGKRNPTDDDLSR